MKFLLEEIDLTKINQLYFLRGYEKKDDDNYCMSMVLMGNDTNEFKATLFLSNKTLSITDGKELLKYLKNTGMKFTAEVLKSDFDKFYNSRVFERLKI